MPAFIQDNIKCFREFFSSVLLNPRTKHQSHKDPRGDKVTAVTATVHCILVGSLYERMCDFVTPLDYKVDRASRACSKIWRFGTVFVYMTERELMWTREERECASKDRCVDMIQKLSSPVVTYNSLIY